MDSGDQLNVAFIETTLNESMRAEVDDLDENVVDKETRDAFRCSTPVLDFVDEKPSFDTSCCISVLEESNVAGICDAMAEVNVKT